MFASASLGRERRPGFEFIPRHRHGCGYLALVLDGGYEEAGDRGRRRVGPGDVILHGRFEAHLDRFAGSGAEILNLALPDEVEPASPFARICDPDAVVRLAERDPEAAAALLLAGLEPVAPESIDWPDALAAHLIRDPSLRLGDWAHATKLADATVSRGFRQIYGLSPCAFRAQARGRLAWRAILTSETPLPEMAVELGFSDQAHMTRTVRAITGQPPGYWRRASSNGFKTGARAAA